MGGVAAEAPQLVQVAEPLRGQLVDHRNIQLADLARGRGFKQQPQQLAYRLADGGFASDQPKWPQVRHSFKPPYVGDQQLAPPEGAVVAQASAIEGEAEHGPAVVMLGHHP
ncbi:hypothetical protein D3C76_1635130 [compost metagenome]